MVKILIPAYNEEENIAKTIKEFNKYGKVVVCDNNSTDNTAKKAKEADAKVIYEKRKGKGFAIKKLLKENAKIYVIADADNAFYGKDCKKMINMICNKEADMVIGRRIDINVHNKNSIFLRSIFLVFLRFLFNKKYRSKTKIEDFMSGFRTFNNKLKNQLNLNSKGFDIETEITIQALKKGFKIKEIPIKVKPRKSGRQKSNILKTGIPVLKKILFS